MNYKLKRQNEMKTFEYTTWDSPSPEPRSLNKAGSDGWELVSVLLIGNNLRYFFKREIKAK